MDIKILFKGTGYDGAYRTAFIRPQKEQDAGLL
jgi:hypothetical protein